MQAFWVEWYKNFYHRIKILLPFFFNWNLQHKYVYSCFENHGSVSKYTKSPQNKFEILAGRFDHIHLDLINPLPPSDNFHTFYLRSTGSLGGRMLICWVLSYRNQLKRFLYTTSFHEKVEKFYRQLKASLKLRCNTIHCSSDLPWNLLGIRSSITEDLNCSAAEMVYCKELETSGGNFRYWPESKDFTGTRNFSFVIHLFIRYIISIIIVEITRCIKMFF